MLFWAGVGLGAGGGADPAGRRRQRPAAFRRGARRPRGGPDRTLDRVARRRRRAPRHERRSCWKRSRSCAGSCAAEVVAAAQRGNQALDQAQRAQEGIAAVRRRLDASGAALAGAAPAAEPAGAGRGGGSRRAARGRHAGWPVTGSRHRGRAGGPRPGRGPDDTPRRGRPEHRRTTSRRTPGRPPTPPAAAGMYGAEWLAAAARLARPREHDRPEAGHRPGAWSGTPRPCTSPPGTQWWVWRAGRAGRALRRWSGRSVDPARAGADPGGDAEQPPRPSGRARSEPEQHPRAGYGVEPGWTGRRDEPEWTDRRDAYAQPDEPTPASRSHRTPERPEAQSWDTRTIGAGPSSATGRAPGTPARAAAAGRRHRRVPVAVAGRLPVGRRPRRRERP